MPQLSQTVLIQNRLGLHARAAVNWCNWLNPLMQY